MYQHFIFFLLVTLHIYVFLNRTIPDSICFHVLNSPWTKYNKIVLKRLFFSKKNSECPRQILSGQGDKSFSLDCLFAIERK